MITAQEHGIPEDCSTRTAVLLPGAMTVAMLGIAALTASLSSLDVRQLFLPYISSAAAISFIAILGYVFVQIAKLARANAESPIMAVRLMLLDRLPLMLLPALVLPLFLVGYTAAKCAIQFLVGYSWDAFFANADHFIFRDDVWHLTRRLLGSSNSWVWEWIYAVGWGAVFFITANAVALFARKKFIGIYFTAMFATWLIGGCILAYAFSAAGPVFAGFFEPGVVARFKPMHQALDASLGTGPIAFTQRYLATIINVHTAVKGGGISAMPSMHLGSATIFVLAAQRTRWLIPSLVFWGVIFIGSGYFGYHYWVDGLAAAVVATFAWKCAEWAYSGRDRHSVASRSVSANAAILGGV